MTAIVATGLSKRYGAVRAVDGVSLRVDRGEIYGFLGLNGAGKTTTIRMLLGMVRPSAGSFSVLGGRGRDVWARVGYLVETPHAYPELTVRQNLDVVRRLRRLGDGRAVADVIDLLALGPYADRPTRTLSLGNAQRLGLAKALIHRPDLVILDEPANGLDPAGVVEIRTLLRRLAGEQGVTVFMSSHILGEVARLATRIGIIHAGRLVQELDAEDLAEREQQRLVVAARDLAAARAALAAAGFAAQDDPAGLALTDEGAIDHPDRIATLLVAAGCPPTRLAVEREDLEQYFLRLVRDA